MVNEVTRMVHADQLQSATQCYLDFNKVSFKAKEDPAQCHSILLGLFHWLLANDAMAEAAQLLWSERLFDPRPACTQAVWKLFSEAPFGLIMGAGSMSKSYTMGVRLFLEWCRDPHGTSVSLIGPNEDHLQRNLFSHLVSLHTSSKLPLPGTIGDLFIGTDRRDQRFAIKGVIIPVGQNKKAGRLQGQKRYPRTEPHPQFGKLSRMFIFFDELENIPGGIWSDVDNLMSTYTDEAPDGLKIFGAFNPSNRDGEVGKRCEPPFGWEDLKLDEHFRWTSNRGWEVLRLDAMHSENVQEGRTVYPGLQTKEGVERIIRNAGGMNSPGYYTFVRACFPPSGVELAIIPSGMLKGKRGEFFWLDTPINLGGCDLALEGGAAAIFCHGLWGLATGFKLPPSIDFPNGQEVMFKDERGRVVPRYGLQLAKMIPLSKGDTVVVAEQVKKLCQATGIKPEWMVVDRTGHGAGVHDVLRNDWSPAVVGLNYSESASETRILAEDTFTPKEEYDRAASELWFALRKFLEFGYLLIDPRVDCEKLVPQMTTRLFRCAGKYSRVESKKEYVKRGNTSPDEVDALTLLVHAARKGSGVILSVKDPGTRAGVPNGQDEDWSRQDPSSTFESLEGGSREDY
jgi:hypothetical protein